MAKAPRPGHVKTRLHAILTPSEAADLGAAFLRDATYNLAEAGRIAPIDRFIAYAPAGQETRFDGLICPKTRLVLADGTDGQAPGVERLGTSLLHATRALLALGYGAVCLINADSPTLPTAFLVRAAQRLLHPGKRPGESVVMGRAEDGGYWLIGTQRAHPALFADIEWSTDRVADQTAAQAARLGLALEQVGTWFDVDDRDSLVRLIQQSDMPSGSDTPFPAPATTQVIHRLNLATRLCAAA